MRSAVERTETEALFEILAKESPVGVYIVQDGKFCYANPAFRSCVGYGENELVGMDSLEFVFPEDREIVRENAIKMLKGELTSAYQFRVIDKTGSIRWVMESVSSIQYRGRRATVGNQMDMTVRNRAEREFKESEARFRTAVELAPYGISLIAKDGKYEYVNPKFTKIFGYSLQDIPNGKEWFRQAYPDSEYRRRVISTWLEDLETYGVGETRPRIFTVTCKDRAERMIEFRPVSLADGRQLISYVDITDQERLHDELRKSEAKFIDLYENASDIIFTIDVEGRFTSVNRAALAATGYSREEILELAISDVVSADSAGFWPDKLQKAVDLKSDLAHEQPWEGEVITKDGRKVVLEIRARLTWEGDHVVGAQAIARDITERKKMQEQLMLADRLASIGQLVSGIAHELNNPLTSVIGFSELLLRRDLPADVKEDLDTVNREARRTSDIVKGLLTFGHQQGTEKALVDINNIIGEVLRLRSYDQRVNNIKVDARFATDLPRVPGNGAQLHQVFINIVINAEQAMLEDRGRGRLTVVTEQLGGVVRTSIVDDGPGISPENMKRLFTPFFTTKEVGNGTGLGLSICHGIVTEHGGKVYAESEPGEGATFVVELPVSNQSGERGV